MKVASQRVPTAEMPDAVQAAPRECIPQPVARNSSRLLPRGKEKSHARKAKRPCQGVTSTCRQCWIRHPRQAKGPQSIRVTTFQHRQRHRSVIYTRSRTSLGKHCIHFDLEFDGANDTYNLGYR